jgi:LysM repeat protein
MTAGAGEGASMRFRLTAAVVCLAGALIAVPTAKAHPHMVRPGESLWSIGVDNGLSAERVAEANGLSVDGILYAGRELDVPAAAPSSDLEANGRLPAASLTSIHSPLGPAQLAPDAAAAWEEMRQASISELGVDLYPSGPAGAYRTYDQQAELFAAFRAGTGNLAAPPGGSAHGYGRAVDLATPQMRRAVDRIGARFGWGKVEAGPEEWFHVNYVGR